MARGGEPARLNERCRTTGDNMAGTPTMGEFTYCRDCGGGLITWVEGRCISCDVLATPVGDSDHLTLLAVAFLTTLANVGRRSGAVSEDDIAFAFRAASANATRPGIEPSQPGGDDDNAGLIAELGDQLRDCASRIASNATALGYREWADCRGAPRRSCRHPPGCGRAGWTGRRSARHGFRGLPTLRTRVCVDRGGPLHRVRGGGVRSGR